MHSQTDRPTFSKQDLMLGVLPGLVYIVSQVQWYLWPVDSLMHTWGVAVLTLAVLIAYGLTAFRARRATAGLIMGAGVLVVLLASVGSSVISQLVPLPAQYVPVVSVRKLAAAFASLSFMLVPAILLVWGGLLVQRGRGPISLLPLASFLFLMQQEIIDPTYAWLIWLPESTAPLAALVIVVVLAPLVIGMPLLTARAGSQRAGYLMLLGMGLLAAELSTFAGLVRVWAMQGQVTNAPSVGQSILRMLTVNQGFVLLPVLVLAAVAAIYAWLERRPPPTHPTPLAASS